MTLKGAPFLYLIALGSCVPPAEKRMQDALRFLNEHAQISVCGQSPLLHNPAVGGVTAQPFVNAVIAASSSLPPLQMLRLGFSVEQRFGRLRTQKNAARTLDVDLVWSSVFFAPKADLLLPHPKAKDRDFVVVPARQAWNEALQNAPVFFKNSCPF